MHSEQLIKNKEAIKEYIKNGEYDLAVLLYENSLSGKEVDWLIKTSIKYGFYRGVDMAIEYGAKINIVYTDLENAIKSKDKFMLEYLIEKGANIFEKEKAVNLDNPLMSYACYSGTPEIIDFLVEKGLDIHANDDNAFENVCTLGPSENLVHLLNKYNYDVNHYFVDSNKTPLSWATIHANVEVVKTLLENNASISEHNNTALSRAIFNPKIEILEQYCNLASLEQLQFMQTHNKTCLKIDHMHKEREEVEKLLNLFIFNFKLKKKVITNNKKSKV